MLKFSEEVSKIHRWVMQRKTWQYRLVLSLYCIGLSLAALLALVPDPLYGNRLFWLFDTGLLVCFLFSHLAYRRKNGTVD